VIENEDPLHKWQRLIHFLVLMLSMEVLPRAFKQQFSVAELFIFAVINAYYTYFFADSIIRKYNLKYIPGCNISNILCFFPWAVLNTTILLGFVYNKIVLRKLALAEAVGVLVVSIAISLVFITPYSNP
jgi:hypothetical protein